LKESHCPLLWVILTLKSSDMPIPLIAAGIAALAAGGSAIAGASANRKNSRILAGLQRENENMYLQEYYRGALDNEGAKAYLKRLDEKLQENNTAIDNQAVATGATHENRLAAKQANNEVMSDAVAGLVEREDNRKMAVKDRYFGNKTSLLNGEMQQNAAIANNWANLGSGISSAAGSLAASYLMGGKGWFNKVPTFTPDPSAMTPLNLQQYVGAPK